MQQWQEPNGHFKHFQMRGGVYEGMLRTILELQVQSQRCADSLRTLDCNDINGTALAVSTLNDVQHRLDRLLDQMQRYREECFTKE